MPLPTPADDIRWYALIGAGDRAAFAEMVRAYADPLAAFAFSLLGSREGAEEIVQDIFFTIWQRRDQLSVQGTLKTYLYSSVRNRAYDYLRRHRAIQRMRERVARDDHAPALAEPPSAADRQLEHDEVVAELHRALESLPEQQRTVVRLRWLDGLSHAEIARVLGISVRTSENHVARALARLRELLAR